MYNIKDWMISFDRVFLSSFGVRIGLLVVGFATSLALARFFGTAAVGEMSLIVALLVVTSHLSLFGSHMTVLKRLPIRDDRIRNETLGPAIVVTMILSGIVGMLLYSLARLGHLGSYAQFGEGGIMLLPIMVFANSYRVLALETLRGLQHIRAYNAVSPLVAIAILGTVVFVFFAGGRQINIPLIILATEVIFLVVTAFIFFRISHRPKINIGFGRSSLLSHLRLSSIFFLSGSSVLFGQLDILVAGYFMPIEVVGIYAIALKLAALVGLVLASANISFAPNVAGVFQNEGIEAAIRLARLQTRMIAPLSAVIGFGIAATGYIALGVFGSAFLPAYPALLILVCAQILGALFGPVGIFLDMTMGHRDMVFVTAGAMSIGLIMALILIPEFGIVGAAVANLFTLLVRSSLATLAIYLRTGTAIAVTHAWRGY